MTPILLELKLLELETSNLVRGFVSGMPSGCTNNFPESGRGLGHVTLQFLAVRSAILATAWLLVPFPVLSMANKDSFIHLFKTRRT